MRVLVITKLFPNAVDPSFAPFNRLQFSALAKHCDLELLATIPWFPGVSFARGSDAAKHAHAPRVEQIDGMRVCHPRVAYVPRIGHAIAGWLYALSLLPRVAPRRGKLDVVLGSFAYPDGWAAVRLARWLGVPAVVKVHGSDINLQSTMPSIAPRLRWVLSKADAIVATSHSLAEAAMAIGAVPERTHVVANGIDLSLFQPRDRQSSRERLGLPANDKLVLYVGNLKQTKGVGDLMRAMSRLAQTHPEVGLLVVGDGPMRGECEAIAAAAKLWVRFAGARPHNEVAQWLAACDVLALPSWAEGMPNVVLEALASGRPVVATNVGGIASAVREPWQGTLVAPRDLDALVAALGEAVGLPHDAVRISSSVSIGDWDDSARRLHAVLAQVVREAERATEQLPCASKLHR